MGSPEVDVLEKRIRELERALVKETRENETLWGAVKVALEKAGMTHSFISSTSARQN